MPLRLLIPIRRRNPSGGRGKDDRAGLQPVRRRAAGLYRLREGWRDGAELRTGALSIADDGTLHER